MLCGISPGAIKPPHPTPVLDACTYVCVMAGPLQCVPLNPALMSSLLQIWHPVYSLTMPSTPSVESTMCSQQFVEAESEFGTVSTLFPFLFSSPLLPFHTYRGHKSVSPSFYSLVPPFPFTYPAPAFLPSSSLFVSTSPPNLPLVENSSFWIAKFAILGLSAAEGDNHCSHCTKLSAAEGDNHCSHCMTLREQRVATTAHTA